MPRSTSLNAKQLAFVNAYMRTRNATQAYMEAYGGTIVNARGHSARLVDNGLVKEEIERRREDLRKEADVQAVDVLIMLKDIMNADAGDFIDDRGNLMKMNEVHYRQRRTLHGWKARRVGRKENVTEIRFCDRMAAAKLLVQYTAMFRDKATFDAWLDSIGPLGVQIRAWIDTVDEGEPALLTLPAPHSEQTVIEGGGLNGHASQNGHGETPSES